MFDDTHIPFARPWREVPREPPAHSQVYVSTCGDKLTAVFPRRRINFNSHAAAHLGTVLVCIYVARNGYACMFDTTDAWLFSACRQRLDCLTYISLMRVFAIIFAFLCILGAVRIFCRSVFPFVSRDSVAIDRQTWKTKRHVRGWGLFGSVPEVKSGPTQHVSGAQVATAGDFSSKLRTEVLLHHISPLDPNGPPTMTSIFQSSSSGFRHLSLADQEYLAACINHHLASLSLPPSVENHLYTYDANPISTPEWIPDAILNPGRVWSPAPPPPKRPSFMGSLEIARPWKQYPRMPLEGSRFSVAPATTPGELQIFLGRAYVTPVLGAAAAVAYCGSVMLLSVYLRPWLSQLLPSIAGLLNLVAFLLLPIQFVRVRNWLSTRDKLTVAPLSWSLTQYTVKNVPLSLGPLTMQGQTEQLRGARVATTHLRLGQPFTVVELLTSSGALRLPFVNFTPTLHEQQQLVAMINAHLTHLQKPVTAENEGAPCALADIVSDHDLAFVPQQTDLLHDINFQTDLEAPSACAILSAQTRVFVRELPEAGRVANNGGGIELELFPGHGKMIKDGPQLWAVWLAVVGLFVCFQAQYLVACVVPWVVASAAISNVVYALSMCSYMLLAGVWLLAPHALDRRAVNARFRLSSNSWRLTRTHCLASFLPPPLRGCLVKECGGTFRSAPLTSCEVETHVDVHGGVQSALLLLGGQGKRHVINDSPWWSMPLHDKVFAAQQISAALRRVGVCESDACADGSGVDAGVEAPLLVR